MFDTIIEELTKTRQEFEGVNNSMDYDEGSWLMGYIAALEWVLERLQKGE